MVTIFVNANFASAYSNNNLIDDAVFDNSTKMDANAIQAFLNQFPNSCLKNYSSALPDSDPYKAYSTYGDSASAAQVIRRVADVWGVNPRVILTKLQQEESLVKGDAGCDAWRYNSAMGYKCPDSAPCDPRYAGFTQQVVKGTWQLKFNKEVSTGNYNWQGNGDIVYGGYMTTGTFKRCSTCLSTYYDGYANIESNLVHMDSGATASLYSYTPHVPSSFPVIFEGFFGSGSTSAYPAGSVFRIYLPWNGEHFYSSWYPEVQSIVSRGARFEGVHFTAPQTATAKPIYRFWVQGNLHFYTIDEGERAYVANVLKFKPEGVAWYAETTPVAGTKPIYRLYNPRSNDHLYTASPQERDSAISIGYRSEGVAFYNY